MESYKLVIHIRYFEFEDGAFVAWARVEPGMYRSCSPAIKIASTPASDGNSAYTPLLKRGGMSKTGMYTQECSALEPAQEQLTKITAKWLEPAPASVK
jgi:hypothetical protein